MTQRILVTGATGFLGRHLIPLLLEQRTEVVALVRKPAGHGLPAGVDVRTGDVLDFDTVKAAAAGCDAAYHAAGLVSRHIDDAEAMYRVHVDGAKVALPAMKEAGVRRVVFVSTSGTLAVSDDPDVVADEDAEPPTATIARWPYYRSKLFAERIALEKNEDGFEVICANPSLMYGPGDERGSSTEDIVNFLTGKVAASPAGGIAFVDARDAAQGLLLAMERGKAGERYILNGANMALSTMFGRLERISGIKAPPVKLPQTSATVAGAGVRLLKRVADRFSMSMPIDPISAEMSQFYWYCDSSKARRELGWESREPGDTLADTVRDLEARGVVWPAGLR